MPKGFVKLSRAGSDPHTFTVAVDQVARYGPERHGCYVVLKTVDDGSSETLRVTETEAEIDALIESAQSGCVVEMSGSGRVALNGQMVEVAA
jgi:hypothetical protein